MLDLTRRRLLKNSLFGTLTLGGAGALPRKAWASPWAELPAGIWPPGYQPKKILEIFCYGGLSQWETIWVAEDTGIPGKKDWRNFDAGVQGMNWHCLPDKPMPSEETISFGIDAAGTPINWGPATKPLWRPDIFSRARMVTLAHDLEPHEAAVPLALTGHRLGNPRMAGKGSAIAHRMTSILAQTLPYAFVLSPDNIAGYTYVQQTAIANGQHPGYAEPLLIKIGDGTFAPLLQRSQMTKQADQLIADYQAMYRDGLRFQGMGEVVRSAGFTSYDTAVNFLLHAGDLYNLFNANSVLAVNNGPVCASNDPVVPPDLPNRTKTALDVATLLLNTGAGYVGVLDGGIRHDVTQNSPYDTHFDVDSNTMKAGQHIELTSANAFNLCSCLAAKIGQNDPDKLDLDQVMIVIHSEFGRTPMVGMSGGRDHWPPGYAAVLIGGPIVSRSINGQLLTDGTTESNHAYSPSDLHGAVLMAAGIDPFASENFGVVEFTSLVSSSGTEDATRPQLRSQILGV
jgi:hypothetical protein